MDIDQFFNEIKGGDIQKIRACLEDPNTTKFLKRPDGNGEYAVHIASKAANSKAVELLLLAGANPNQESEEKGSHLGYSAAHHAAANDDVETLRILSNFKVNFNRPSTDLWTPLHVAAYKGKYQALTYLLENGADVSCANNYKQTPLVFASSHGRVRDVRLLLKHKADINFKDLNGDTLLHHALQFQMSKLFEGEYEVPDAQLDVCVTLALSGLNPDECNLDGSPATIYIKEDIPSLPDVLRLLYQNASRLGSRPTEWNYMTFVSAKPAHLVALGFTDEEATSFCAQFAKVDAERLDAKKRRAEELPSGGCPVMTGRKKKAAAAAGESSGGVPSGHPNLTKEEIDAQLRSGEDPSKGQCPFFQKRAGNQGEAQAPKSQAVESGKTAPSKCPFSWDFIAAHQTTVLLMCLSFVVGMWTDQFLNRFF